MDSPAAKLVVIGGVLSGEVFPLEGVEVTFGRDAANTVGVADPALSRRHCSFTREADGWCLRDLGSSNGTFVNGVQVQTHTLSEGDRIAAGSSVLLYVHAASGAATAVDLEHDEPLATSRLAPDSATYLQPHAPSGTGPRRSEEGLRTLLAISTVIYAIQNEEQLHRELLDLLFEAVPAQEGAILRPGADEELEVLAVRPVASQGAVHVNGPGVRQALAERVGILFSSRMAVPIALHDRVMGAIYLAARSGVEFTEEHLQLVTAVGRIAAAAVANVRHLAAIERERDRLQGDLHLAHQMIGESAAVRQVYARIAKLARVDVTGMRREPFPTLAGPGRACSIFPRAGTSPCQAPPRCNCGRSSSTCSIGSTTTCRIRTFFRPGSERSRARGSPGGYSSG